MTADECTVALEHALGEVYARYSDHYAVEVTVRPHPELRLIARASVMRRDSAESVAGVQIAADDDATVVAKLAGALVPVLARLPELPSLWGQLECRRIVVEYRAMNDLLTSTLSRLRQALESGTLTNDQLHDEFWKSREIAIRGGVQISSALSRLSDSQRVALMCVSENEYTRLDDPYVLDEVDARDSLFDFIEQPSEEVLIAHEIHLRRCGRGGAGAA